MQVFVREYACWWTTGAVPVRGELGAGGGDRD